jgi:hypothetical protein
MAVAVIMRVTMAVMRVAMTMVMVVVVRMGVRVIVRMGVRVIVGPGRFLARRPRIAVGSLPRLRLAITAGGGRGPALRLLARLRRLGALLKHLDRARLPLLSERHHAPRFVRSKPIK